MPPIATVLYGVLRLGVGIFLPRGYGSPGTFARLAVILCFIFAIAMILYQVDFAAAGKENAVIVIPHYVRHVYQIPPVAAVKAAPKLSFQFLTYRWKAWAA